MSSGVDLILNESKMSLKRKCCASLDENEENFKTGNNAERKSNFYSFNSGNIVRYKN